MSAETPRGLRHESTRASRKRACLWLALMVTCLASAGCDGEGQTREEGRQLLQAINDLQEIVKLADRKTQLDALEQLPLKAPEHVRVRAVCLKAHRQLLEAEIEQAEAKRTMDQATPKNVAEPLPKQAADAIAASIKRSDVALAAARTSFPECQQAMQGLIAKLR